MYIRIGYEIGLLVTQPTPVVALLEVHPDRQKDLCWESGLVLSSGAATVYRDSFANHCHRFVAAAGETTLSYDALIEDSGRPEVMPEGAGQLPVEELPADALTFLLGSRYCETDHLSSIAWKLFGDVPAGYPRVRAICNWVHDRLSFSYGYARATRTACQAYEERVGVCRDFAHLAIALCRCLNIPARYVNGYLGDVNVVADPAPMDFSAWFEVYLEGGWHTFDARHNEPRTGRVVVARGRDAADVPLIHTFGSHELSRFKVWTYEEPAEGRLVPSADDLASIRPMVSA